jgi:hypothetical protein
MDFRRPYKFAAIAIAVLALAQFAQAQTAGDGKIANMSVGTSSVRWDMLVPNSGGSVTIAFPDGRSVKKTFRAGGSAEFDLSDKQLESLPDGVYNYDLRLAPVLSAGDKETMMKGRGADDDPEIQRNLRKRPALPSLNQSGTFALVNGALIGPGAIEGERTGANTVQPQPAAKPAPARVSANTVTRLRNHRFSLGMMPDIVFADDVIIQGSACVGLDCVNNEVFNFDSIRLKENNTRIGFTDTSTSAGFPTNDWTIRANSSASGGGSFLAFVDRGASGTGDETGTIVFEVDAGAPANSLRVSNLGRIGVRTGTPVLDVHVNSSNTPGYRMEQNNSGGFTAQTWDVAGNEANFFVRDVTSGSRLPFRIRPGAPTSSIDISANGMVGIGTASPTSPNGFTNTLAIFGSGSSSAVFNNNTATFEVGTDVGNRFRIIGSAAGNVLTADINGNVGLGTTAPDQRLSVQGDADKSAGGTSWGVFSDERLKDIKGNYSRGLSAVMGLRPVRFSYKKENALKLQSDTEIIGFSAQELQKLVPEAVSKSASGYLVVHSDAVLWAMLNAIKEQQQQIEQLKGQIHKLQTAPRRRHK